MSIRIRYKGVESEEFPILHPKWTEAERTLLTAGKYCEDNITVISDLFPTDEMLGTSTVEKYTVSDGLGLNLPSSRPYIQLDWVPELGTADRDPLPGYYCALVAFKDSDLPSEYTVTWIDPNDSTDTPHEPAGIWQKSNWTGFFVCPTKLSRVFDPFELTITANGASSTYGYNFAAVARRVVSQARSNSSQMQDHVYAAIMAKLWYMAVGYWNTHA